MTVMMGIHLYIVCFLAYIIGSIPTGVLLSRAISHRDVRQFGSGNIGTTNMTRMLGLPVVLLTLVGDAFEGYVAAALPFWLQLPHAPLVSLITGLIAIVGHAFSCFLKFKGGKSVATTAGVLLAIDPKLLLLAMAIFLVTLAITSTVSLASIIGLWGTTIAIAFMTTPLLVGYMAVVSVFVTARHWPNINRLLTHSERTIPYGLFATWQHWQHRPQS